MTQKIKKLAGKKVFITGASQGIGLAMAKCFAAEGAELFLNARNQQALENTASLLKESGHSLVHCFPFDVSNFDDVQGFFKTHSQALKGLDVLINNAGQMPISSLMLTKPDALEKCFQTNVFGSMYCAQFATRLMMRQKSGSVINISSVVAKQGAAGQTVYGASKSALDGFTRSLAKEMGAFNIRVNCISPGMIDTDLLNTLSDDLIQKTLTNSPLKRLGSPDEVAQLALFLASDKSSYITGQVIAIDGGLRL